MPNDSPAVILYDAQGNQVALKDGYSITVDSRGFLALAQDDVSGEARILASNQDGYLRISAPALETDLSSLESKDFATETTLATRAAASTQTDGSQKTQVVDGADTLDINASGQAAVQDPPNLDVALSTRASEATLALIKDTDGIKKITDELPAGTQEIGYTGQGTKADPADAWPVAPYDDRGNQLALKDGYVVTADTRGIPAVGEDDVSGEARILAANQDGYLRISAPTVEEVLSSIDGKDFATETTLASIKDTDGVKKITDPLPAGSNEIGAVAQGTKAAAADGWPVVLYDASGNPVAVTLDGGIYRLESFAKLRNASGTNINPSTEEKQDDSITQLTTIDSVLDSIKDTDGIKKITDELPAGTQEIGSVAQGTKAAAADAWPVVPYDAYGAHMPVRDGYDISSAKHGFMVAGWTGTTAQFLKTDNEGALNVVTGSTVGQLVVAKLEESGGATNMNVDGSGTPVSFTFDADPVLDRYLQFLRIVFLPNVLRMDDGSFGSLSGPLSNGCRLSITSEGDETELALFRQTEDIVALPGGSVFIETNLTANDLLVVTLAFGGAVKLVSGSADNVEMLIQDDLTGAGPNDIVHFSTTVTAIEE